MSSTGSPSVEPVPPLNQGEVTRLPELLAPAGDWECAKAAVENGADAIYYGLEKFNARMRAHNFTVADLPKLMEFLHRRGVRATSRSTRSSSRMRRQRRNNTCAPSRRRRCGHRAGCGRLPAHPKALTGLSIRLDTDDGDQLGWRGFAVSWAATRRAGERVFDQGGQGFGNRFGLGFSLALK
jgi:hypothetical protein